MKTTSNPPTAQDVLRKALETGHLAPTLHREARAALGMTSSADAEREAHADEVRRLVRHASGDVTVDAGTLRVLLEVAETASWMTDGIVTACHLEAIDAARDTLARRGAHALEGVGRAV